MRCKNQGSDYEDENIQWTCTASLPSEFKLGSTDVICEGYDSSSDPYVLKGSCGVEYRLALTDVGEKKYGRGSDSPWGDLRGGSKANFPAIIFWMIFFAVVAWMLYSVFVRDRRGGVRRGGGNNTWGWGGGGGGDPGGDDPPPPYDYQPPRGPKASTAGAAPGQHGDRPGFWTGALSGAAAGYFAGNRGRNQQTRNQGWGNPQGGGLFGGGDRGRVFGDNAGEGSSTWGARGGSGSSPSSFSSTRHESSGFGSTNRR